MITRYTPPIELIDEFSKDRERARYWQNKMTGKQSADSKSFKNFKSAFYSSTKDVRSETIEYDSPLYGNKWLLWWRYISRGYGRLPEFKDYQICYYLTDQYMTVMCPTKIYKQDVYMKGVTMFTDHVFLRLHQRLGVNMSDRKLVIRNFIEQVLCGILDIREPRKGEELDQVICRLPKSWLRGHIIYANGSYLIRFNTFYTDMELSSSQRRYLMSFAKFADAFDSKDEIKEYFTQQEDTYWDNFINNFNSKDNGNNGNISKADIAQGGCQLKKRQSVEDC